MKLILNLLNIFIFSTICCNACPTCVARIKPDSPAFFHEDFYVKEPEQQTSQLKEDKDKKIKENE